MCQTYDCTKQILKIFIKKDRFKKDELYKAIRDNGGVMRIKAGYSVKDYLNDLEYDGQFKYIPKTREYVKIK
jgi:hypothetical protein